MHWTKFKYENKQRAITKKLCKQELRFKGTALPLDEIQPQNFITIASSFGEMHQTKLKYENKLRAMTQKLSKEELRFMGNTLPLDKICPLKNFHNHS